MSKGETMNILPVGYKNYNSIQNQNTHKSPNFKSTLVANFGKTLKGCPQDLMLQTTNLAIHNHIPEAGDRLVASTESELCVWLDGKFDSELSDVAGFLNRCFATVADVKFEVVKGMHDAVKKRLAEIAAQQ
jgi:hypothetical protein